MDFAGLIFDESRHYIDHLAPFCSLMGWPLIIHEPTLADETRKFYPDLEVIEAPIFPKILITCDPQPLLDAAFPTKRLKTIWLPHGNSDKGPFFEALQQNEIVLVYGQKMIDAMRLQGVLAKTIRVGNFRWEYFLKHRTSHQKKKKTFLYAPTWDDNCSFWHLFPKLVKKLSKDCQLLVKLHPNTIRKYEDKIEILIGRYASENIQFLPNDPPIYPILSRVDAYIGDMSSIGYDFLTFDRPMFFFNYNDNLPLHQAGLPVEKLDLIEEMSHKRKKLYQYTFDPTPNFGNLKREIYAACGL